MKTFLSNCLLIVVFLNLSLPSLAQDAKFDSLKLLVAQHQERDTMRVSRLVDLTGFYTTRDFNKSLPLITEAIAIAKEIRFVRGVGYSLNALSTYYTLSGELDSALIRALEAEQVLLSINDQSNLLVTYSTMARIYAASGKYKQALEIQLKNVDLVKDRKASPAKASYYFYVGQSYDLMEDYDLAEEYFLEALNISRICDFATGVAIAEGSLGMIYGEQGKHSKGIEYLKRTIAFSEKHEQYANMAAAYLSIGKSYNSLKKYDLAIQYNTKSILLNEQMHNHRTLKEAYGLQCEYYEEKQQYDSANFYLRRHYAMVDTLFSIAKVNTVEELQTKFETEKKEAEIVSLSQRSHIQTLELKEKNQSMIIGLAVFLMLFLGGFFIYRQRMAKRQKTQIEVEQRFLRSQLNPHFIFNALLAIQNFMLKNSAEAAALYLSKFAKLMRQILENSRQELIPVEEEIKMISNYMDIHKMRLNDVFDYQIEISDAIDIELDTIPPMFVQPFIENAIEHGMAGKTADGLISLKLEKQGEYISIEIVDNGGGLQHGIVQDKEHSSLATTIIQERMALFNQSLKTKIKLVLADIRDNTDEIQGTRVELKVPFNYL